MQVWKDSKYANTPVDNHVGQITTDFDKVRSAHKTYFDSPKWTEDGLTVYRLYTVLPLAQTQTTYATKKTERAASYLMITHWFSLSIIMFRYMLSASA